MIIIIYFVFEFRTLIFPIKTIRKTDKLETMSWAPKSSDTEDIMLHMGIEVNYSTRVLFSRYLNYI